MQMLADTQGQVIDICTVEKRLCTSALDSGGVTDMHGQQCNITYRNQDETQLAWFKSCCLTLFYPDHFILYRDA